MAMTKLIWLLSLFLGVILAINALLPPAGYDRSLFKFALGVVLIIAGYVQFMKR